MKSISVFRAFGIWALVTGIVTTLAQSDGAGITSSCSTTEASKTHTPPWDDPTHTPSTFTTMYLTYSTDSMTTTAQATAAPIRKVADATVSSTTTKTSTHTPPWDNPTHSASTFTTIYLTYSPDPTSTSTEVVSTGAIGMTTLAGRNAVQLSVVASTPLGDGGSLHNFATKPYGEVFHEDANSTLSSFTINGTLTLAMTATSTTIITVYTGPIVAETMVTVGSTPTATQGVNATVTDTLEVVSSSYTAAESTATVFFYGAPGNSTTTSITSGSSTTSPTSGSSMAMDSTMTMAPSETVASHTVPTPPYGLTPISLFDTATPGIGDSATATSIGGAAPTGAVKKTLAAMLGLVGAAVLVL